MLTFEEYLEEGERNVTLRSVERTGGTRKMVPGDQAGGLRHSQQSGTEAHNKLISMGYKKTSSHVTDRVHDPVTVHHYTHSENKSDKKGIWVKGIHKVD